VTHIAFALLAGAGFACSALLGLFGIRVSAALRLVSIAVAAGVLLAIAFVDLLPEAFSRTSTARAAIAFTVGLRLLLAIKRRPVPTRITTTQKTGLGIPSTTARHTTRSSRLPSPRLVPGALAPWQRGRRLVHARG